MVEVRPCLPRDFAGILELQRLAHRDQVDPETRVREGYVSWRHNLPTLRLFNAPVPHTVAVNPARRVVGFALSMDPLHAATMPEAKGFVAIVEKICWPDRPLAEASYVCMGQIAIAPEHRGTGLFRRLYEAWFAAQAVRYGIGVTEIAEANTRSRKAHEALGWEEIARHHDGQQTWIIVGKELK